MNWRRAYLEALETPEAKAARLADVERRRAEEARRDQFEQAERARYAAILRGAFDQPEVMFAFNTPVTPQMREFLTQPVFAALVSLKLISHNPWRMHGEYVWTLPPEKTR